MKIIRNERGSVMSIALLFLILLTSLVMFISRSSTTDIQISANERAAAIAFYAADAGAYASAKMVGKAMDNRGTPSFGNDGDDFPEVDFIITGGATDFYQQVKKANTGDVDTVIDPRTAARGDEDIEFSINGRRVKVAISRDPKSSYSKGSGVEFGAGSMGIGAGAAAGGVTVAYRARSVAEGPKNAMEEINVSFRKKSGTAGGL